MSQDTTPTIVIGEAVFSTNFKLYAPDGTQLQFTCHAGRTTPSTWPSWKRTAQPDRPGLHQRAPGRARRKARRSRRSPRTCAARPRPANRWSGCTRPRRC